MIENIVDRLVIRGDDPREPHASESWMKIRAVAVAITPGVIWTAIATAIGVPDIVSIAVAVVLVYLTIEAVTDRINDRIDALEATTDNRGSSE